MPSKLPGNESQHSDPGLLQLIGAAADLLSLGEHVQRLLPIDRIRARSRHRRLGRLTVEFTGRLEDARAGLRVVTSVLQGATPRGPGPFTVGIRGSELPVFRRGLDQLQVAIRGMTHAAYELETVTSDLGVVGTDFYRMSESGQVVLQSIKTALDDDAVATTRLLGNVDTYLTRCSEILEETSRRLSL